MGKDKDKNDPQTKSKSPQDLLDANPNIEDNNKTSPFDILSASGLENLFHQYCEKFQIEPFQEKASTSSPHLTRKS